MSADYYKQALDLIGKTHTLNLVDIAIDYAKRHPADFCRIAEPDEAYKTTCKEMVKSGRKIDAIKLWRLETGDGLKEAKEAVESL